MVVKYLFLPLFRVSRHGHIWDLFCLVYSPKKRVERVAWFRAVFLEGLQTRCFPFWKKRVRTWSQMCLHSCVAGKRHISPVSRTCCVWLLTQHPLRPQCNSLVRQMSQQRQWSKWTVRCLCNGTGEKATFHRPKHCGCWVSRGENVKLSQWGLLLAQHLAQLQRKPHCKACQTINKWKLCVFCRQQAQHWFSLGKLSQLTAKVSTNSSLSHQLPLALKKCFPATVVSRQHTINSYVIGCRLLNGISARCNFSRMKTA